MKPDDADSAHLHCDVEARHIEGLKHNLGSVFSVLRSVERGLGEQKEMILWLCSEVLEDTLLPESLHQVPVLNDAVTNGVLGGIARYISFISNVEVCQDRKKGRIQ